MTEDEEIKSAYMVYNSFSSKEKPFIRSRAASSRQKSKIDNSGINGELENINKGVCPFESENSGVVSVSDAIKLCQKAYWNVAIFRSTIDVQSEFSNSRLRFRSPNKRVEKFFTSWYKKIGGWTLGDSFFREWFRSGNVFLYRFDGKIEWNEIRKLSRTDTSNADIVRTIPLKYVILDPGQIACLGGSSFVDAEYGKMLTSYEVSRLKSAHKTDKEKEFFDNLSEENRKSIMNGTNPMITLDSDKLISVFCSKQDYEAMSVPMYYPVLNDINLKLEFKKAEQVVARTVDYAVLLVTCGSDKKTPKENDQLANHLAELFSSESVGRVLISDATTKMDFTIPDLNKIFGEEKYKVVNSDIANGLMNIFWGDEKFANSMVKIQVFLERLNQAREAYLNMFLRPEMERIAKEIGFNQIPDVFFEQINLKDEVEYMKIYTRLAESGLITPTELFDSFESHKLPLKEDSLENQKEFKKLRDSGLYEPLLGGKANTEAGRPDGTKAPKKVKVGPIGASKGFSVSKIRDSIKYMEAISSLVEEAYKEKNKLHRLSKKHKDVCWALSESIFINEPKENWESSVVEYMTNYKPSGDVTDKVLELASEHSVSPVVGSILYNSITERAEEV